MKQFLNALGCCRSGNDYKIEVPEYFNFGIDVIDRRAADTPLKPAMLWVNQQGDEQRFTYSDISRMSSRAANFFLRIGVKAQDRVLVILPRIPAWWFAVCGLIKSGAIHCPAPVMLTEYDLRGRINAGGFSCVITDAENADKIDHIAAECPTLVRKVIVDAMRPGWNDFHAGLEQEHDVLQPVRRTRSSDPMVIYFTSGTNNIDPKMVCHNHSLPLGHVITAGYWHDLHEDDLHFTLSDTGWAKCAWGKLFGQWLLGACVFVYDIRGKFHAEELLPLIEKYRINVFCAPPTVYRMLVHANLSKYDFSSLRHCCSAGEPMNTETIRIWFSATGLRIYEAYGQTESVCMTASTSAMEYRPGSMGKPTPGWALEIIDDNGKAAGPHVVGRIAVNLTRRPVGLFDGYLNHEEANAEVFVDNYYFTGDKAYYDEEGFFWYVGRSDDVIKSSGYRIGPLEVENAIMEHQAVCETAVIGVPDEIRGAVIKAYVVLKPGFDPSEELKQDIQHMVKNLTAPYKYPRIIEFADALPKTISGKIRRNILRERSCSADAAV